MLFAIAQRKNKLLLWLHEQNILSYKSKWALYSSLIDVISAPWHEQDT